MLPNLLCHRTLRHVGCALIVALSACSDEGSIGEPCDQAGKADGECESGAVCGKDTNGALRCLQICNEQTDCGSGKDCNGVEGSNLKACRVKSGTTDTDGGKK